MYDLVEVVRKKHFASPGASEGAIVATEKRLGRSLPLELALFYRLTDGASLFSCRDPLYRILPLLELELMRTFMYGASDPDYGSDTLVCVCDMRDRSGIAVELAQGASYGEMRYCYPMEFPASSTRVAGGFAEFLAKALGSDNVLFW